MHGCKPDALANYTLLGIWLNIDHIISYRIDRFTGWLYVYPLICEVRVPGLIKSIISGCN